MQRLVLAVVSALVAVALWWAFSDSSTRPTTAPPAGVAGLDPTAAADSSTGRDTQPQRSDPGIERAEVSPGAYSGQRAPEGSSWVDLQVFDRETRRPVAGAEVRWAPELAPSVGGRIVGDLMEMVRNANDRELRTRASGSVCFTDSEGRARVLLRDRVPGEPPTALSVTARHEGRYGQAVLRGKRPQKVWLSQDVAVEVRVVDAAGAPRPGVAVALTRVNAGDARSRTPLASVRETDDRGVATWKHAQQLRWEVYDDPDSPPVALWRIAIANAGVDAEALEVDPSALPSEPLTITLPDTGGLRVRLLAASAPFPIPQNNFPPGYATLTEQPERTRGGIRRMRRADPDGWITFGDVGLGQSYTIGQRSWRCEVAGPEEPGEVVEHVVELSERFPFVVATLIGLDSAPIVGGSCALALIHESGEELDVLSAPVEDGGRVRIMAAPQTALPDADRVELRWRREGAPELRATLTSPELGDGLNDLGPVPLRPIAAAVAGRVELDDAGGQLRSLYVERYQETEDGRAYWRRQMDVKVALTADGTFEGKGELKPGRYRVNASSDNLICPPVEFFPGQRDVVVRGSTGCRAEVALRTPEPMRLGQLLVALVDQRGEREEVLPFPEEGQPGRMAARTTQLAPGTYDVSIRWRDRKSSPLHTVSGVEIRAVGDVTKVEIDVRPFLQQFEVELRLADGAALSSDAGLFSGEPPAGGTWWGEPLQVGRQRVTRPVGFPRLTVAAWGFRPETITPGEGPIQVTLQPWPTATVRVSGLEALPAGTVTRLHANVPASNDEARQFWLSSFGGKVRDLLEGGSSTEELVDGVAEVPFGGRPLSLSVTVTNAGADEQVQVQGLSVTELSAPGAYVVSVPAEEAERLRALLEGGDDR